VADASSSERSQETQIIQTVLRQHVEGKTPKFEETLRRGVREVVRAAG
jgi:hypothetical protein